MHLVSFVKYSFNEHLSPWQYIYGGKKVRVSRSILHVKPYVAKCFASRLLYSCPHACKKSVGLPLLAGTPPPDPLHTWYVWIREGDKARERV